MSVSRRAQTGRNKYVCCMHVVIATTRCLQPMDTVCRFSGPSTPRFGSPLKCKPFALVPEAVSGDVSHQCRSFDDLKRFNNPIAVELAWRYYVETNKKMKQKIITTRVPIRLNHSKALDAITSHKKWAKQCLARKDRNTPKCSLVLGWRNLYK